MQKSLCQQKTIDRECNAPDAAKYTNVWEKRKSGMVDNHACKRQNTQ
jgi:hypothetical protein